MHARACVVVHVGFVWGFMVAEKHSTWMKERLVLGVRENRQCLLSKNDVDMSLIACGLVLSCVTSGRGGVGEQTCKKEIKNS